ncbi:efflux RND transporter periplasmic adaptor subunit [Oceanicella actignis]|uniref:Membrane fusion protein, multidrug efflux system n=1 Tax=Oceanicella actignis TaxID=1189325 RepID=A0A1M7RVT7_9RHOB|nr:efflux RND transporter periplasmic adaptor subunit [Oceanicella actignis]SET00999.1 membrane fusion protein, multidrug efflux system [Oceanicella actignis]SHN50383.1 membrane fusion protein, multidrug efflux system [Oceanicella actignis]
MRLAHLLTAALVAAGLYWWVVATPPRGQEPPTPAGAAQAAPRAEEKPMRVAGFLSRARPVESEIALRGRTEAQRRVEVRAETSGLVISDPLRAGAEVRKGDVLCRIEMGARAAQLAEAEAALASAEADDRAAQTLSRKGYASDIVAAARRAQLEAARARLAAIRRDIEKLVMTAPFDGFLETDAAETGALLRNGDVCATVIALDPIKLVGFVPEVDVDRLAPGMEARGRLASGRPLAGRISFVSRSADPATRTFRVEVQAPNPDADIRDGMTAEIAVPLTGERAHMLPQAALTLDDSGRLGVRVAEGGRARFVPVEILRDEPVGVWVRGLPDEAMVIVVGQEYVGEGRPVLVTEVSWTPEDGGVVSPPAHALAGDAARDAAGAEAGDAR